MRDILLKVAAHLKEQDRPAMDGESCKYRASNGLKCAVGCLISDEYYDPDIEGASVADPEVFKLVEKSQGISIDMQLMGQLEEFQKLHDSVAYRDMGYEGIRERVEYIVNGKELLG